MNYSVCFWYDWQFISVFSWLPSVTIRLQSIFVLYFNLNKYARCTYVAAILPHPYTLMLTIVDAIYPSRLYFIEMHMQYRHTHTHTRSFKYYKSIGQNNCVKIRRHFVLFRSIPFYIIRFIFCFVLWWLLFHFPNWLNTEHLASRLVWLNDICIGLHETYLEYYDGIA